MDYLGLTFKYPIHRALTSEEVYNKLDVRKKLDVKLLDQICTIKINSTYFESVDKFFTFKGSQALLSGVILLIFLSMILFSNVLVYFIQWGTLAPDQKGDAVWFTIGATAIGAVMSTIGWKLFRKEAFAWTHYPIRLNRRNRMVYVFRTNGTVLSAPWDDIFFTLEFSGPAKLGNIQGHILDKRSQRVQETFAFSAVSTSKEILLGHWEFLRRYMEEGPQAVIDEIVYCMPVDGKHEPFKSGMERVFAHDYGFPIAIRLIMWPLNFMITLARYFAMRTSRIPVWPKEVEEACPVDPGDPYVKDSRINPPEFQ